jgi:calcium-translocating P-type ATPase
MGVPADLRLIETRGALADESALTGESLPVEKDARSKLDVSTPVADRRTLLHAGTVLRSGRATGVIVATGAATEIGRIASSLAWDRSAPAPLVRRLDTFARWLGLAVLAIIAGLVAVQMLQGVPPLQILLVAVALMVSAIPEGLPVAITVALSVATHRMARRNVIVRSLPAVEGLGSCTLIASDKTGTLTQNRLTVRRLAVADEAGRLSEPFRPEHAASRTGEAVELLRLAAICNEAELHGDGRATGDAVDLALLETAAAMGVDIRGERRQSIANRIAYEPERRYAAVFIEADGAVRAVVKGAAETVLPMCAIADPGRAHDDAEALAADGYRVIALATGAVASPDETGLNRLGLAGLLGIIDPVRPEVPEAIGHCRSAGISVRMVTGDHPATALSIARGLGIAGDRSEVAIGADLTACADDRLAFDERIRRTLVFARVDPLQKLDIVGSLRRQGHIVAVTGDGVNDAPALKAADIGVAMGRGGTDVARDAADLVLTDNNFAAIVAGIEEGRVARDNVRKVITLLLATGAAEIALFVLAVFAGLPAPLTAVQLLWLNLVTNGIQDVALAFERGEPGILERPPRPPSQPLVDRWMAEQIVLTGLAAGFLSFLLWVWALGQGMGEAEARNLTLLMLVLFENVYVLSVRSESRAFYRVPVAANPYLVWGVLGSLALHVAAMFWSGLGGVIGAMPSSAGHWLMALAAAVVAVLVAEAHKAWRALLRQPPSATVTE